MAKVTEIKNIEKVDKQPDVDIKLELNSKEAEAFFAVLMKIGGCPDKSSRKYFEDISNKMREIGFGIKGKFYENGIWPNDLCAGGIIFNDTI